MSAMTSLGMLAPSGCIHSCPDSSHSCVNGFAFMSLGLRKVKGLSAQGKVEGREVKIKR